MPGMRPHLAVASFAFAFAVASAAAAQGPIGNHEADDGVTSTARMNSAVTREDLAVITAEISRLRAEVAALRSELAEVKRPRDQNLGTSEPEDPRTPEPQNLRTAYGPAFQPEQAAPGVEMLRTQVEELAQTKVESQSKMPVRLFGAIVSNTVSNSGVANWLENPNLVDAEVPGVAPGSFTSTLKQSQIGLNVGPIPVASLTASGTVVADFLGGTPSFVTGTVMGLPRMVYAFMRLEGERTALQVGQDHNLLAPRDPTSLAAQTFPLLFRAGNLYLRSPQVRVEQRLGGLTLKGGIAAPLAADPAASFVFAPVAGAGERSRRPALESRVDYTAGSPDGRGEFTLGLSGRYGWRKPADELNSAGSYAVDFNVRAGRVGAAGEFFHTDDAAEFGAAVAQARSARGGWVEGRVALTSKLSANAGVGLDRVRGDVPATARQENKSVFGNVIFDLTPEVAVSMEYRWLETQLGNALAKRENHHVNAAFVVRF
jgi:hypothetical protein